MPALTTSSTSYVYNADGQLVTATFPEGAASQTVGRLYDPTGRLTSVTDSLAGITRSFMYTPGSLPLSVATSDGETLTYGYGVDGPMLMSRTWSGLVSGSIAVTHDDFFHVASRAVDGQGALSMLYDADGLYAGTTGLASYSVTRDYNGKNGLLTGSTLGGVSDGYTYNGFAELKTYTASASGNPLYATTITARDANGRIQGMTDTLAGTMHTWSFTYDPRGELSTAVLDGLSTAYTYDTNGNRVSAGGPASTYDAQDRLLSSPGAAYTYTNNGDLLTKVTPAGTTTYAYDLQNSLRSVGLPGGDAVAYVIDGEGHRVGKTWTHGGQSVMQGFLYDDALRVAAELDGTGNVVSTFVYGTKGNVPDAMVRGGNTYRLLSDWRGSVRAVVDVSAGIAVETIDYDAWGNATVNDTTCAGGDACAPFQPFGFAGGLYDRETGLVRFGARDYDPIVGRWVQKDRTRFRGGYNLYGYSHSDPVNRVDRTGRFDGPVTTMTMGQGLLAGGEAGAGGLEIGVIPVIVGGGLLAGGAGLGAAAAYGATTGPTSDEGSNEGGAPPAGGAPPSCGGGDPPPPDEPDCSPCQGPLRPDEVRVDTTHPHGICPGSHVHYEYWIWRQNPSSCDCFENKVATYYCL